MKMKTNLLLLVCLLMGLTAFGQRQIRGTVTASDGEALVGATVLIKSTGTGTVTDIDGNYSLDVPEGLNVLIFRYTGFTEKEITLTASNVIDVVLEESIAQLDEVVVTALGVSREKKALGYSVTEVSGDDINVARETNALNALQGRVAGVNINQGASGPGGSTRVIIRGNASLTGNNQPLYVVDGVVIDNNVLGSAGAWGGRDFGDGISNINPDDIESVSVLKGPNAAALYGQRGANGVILINTKTGAGVGRTEVNFSSNFTVGTPAIFPEFQNTYGQGLNGEFTHFRQADGSIVANDGSTSGTPQGFPAPTGGAPEGPPSWGPRMDGQQYYDVFGNLRTFSPQPDNARDFLQNQQTWTNTLSVRGGTDALNYALTGTFMDNQGMLPTNTLKRYNGTLRVGAKLSEKFTLDAKLTYVRQESFNRPNLADEQQNVMYALRYIPRDVPLSSIEKFAITADELDQLVGLSGGALTPGYERHWSSGTFTGNPYWSVNNTRNEDTRDRTISFAKLTYDITDWLSLSARIGNDSYTDQILEWQEVGTRVQPVGSVGERVNRVRETNADFLLTANRNITDDLGFSLSFGGNAQELEIRRVGFSGNTFNFPGLPVVNNTIRPSRNSNFGLNNSRINSLYAFGQFSYKNAYYIDWTARNDWSSTLSPDNWSFFYPSVSVSAVLSEVLDLPQSFSFLKIRGSWAQAGNSGNPYQIFGTYGLGAFRSFTTASFTNRIPFEDLQNELTESIEFGLEASFFKGRLSLDATYYNAATENQILSAAVSRASGFGTQLINAGQIDNRGFEFLITGSPLRSARGLNWEVSFNFARNVSEVVALTDDIERLRTGAADRNADVFADVGDLFGNIYSRNFYLRDDDGNRLIDASTGLPIRQSGRRLVGNALPDWTGGLRNSFSYRNLSLSILLDISQGADIYSQSNMYMTLYGTGAWTEDFREGGLVAEGIVANQDADGSWVPTGQQNTTAVTAQEYWLNAVPGSTQAITEEFVYDGSYVAIREIVLGYTFPKSVVDKLPIRSLRLSLVGRNLGYLQNNVPGVAPDAYIFNRNTAGGGSGVGLGIENNSFPIARTFGFDLNIGF
ncbi:MAG: SusC/RagA family TonB-linked outer membrane protein [Saprospiraceae bacterium]|nr:SusC/RagA family TonB-linked outer membrane protein [Saprospiraceae bacterium]